ncbi:MAG: lipocalin-like domain-containing protein [Blastocatellia bacterium]
MTYSSPGQQFAGAWKLLSAVYERDGQQAFPFGQAPVGLLFYDAAGNMAVQIMSRQYIEEGQQGRGQDGRASFAGYLAYFGTYEIDAAASRIIHHVSGSTLAHWVGGIQTRQYHFPEEHHGDCLILSAPATRDGQGAAAVLTWERLQP